MRIQVLRKVTNLEENDMPTNTIGGLTKVDKSKAPIYFVTFGVVEFCLWEDDYVMLDVEE